MMTVLKGSDEFLKDEKVFFNNEIVTIYFI